MTLHELNDLPAAEAQHVLLQCCGSHRWAERMVQLRPFHSTAEVLRAADHGAQRLTDQDWLEAFAAHPRIGERSTSLWSQAEQAAALNAEDKIKQEIKRANAEYESKFGFIFIVFASGKTPSQILQLIEQRKHNNRATELANAAAEQRHITRARLHKLLEI